MAYRVAMTAVIEPRRATAYPKSEIPLNVPTFASAFIPTKPYINTMNP